MPTVGAPNHYSLDEALEPRRPCAKARIGTEMFPAEAFVEIISDEIESLRRAEKSDEEIVTLIRQNSSIEITAKEISDFLFLPPGVIQKTLIEISTLSEGLAAANVFLQFDAQLLYGK